MIAVAAVLYLLIGWGVAILYDEEWRDPVPPTSFLVAVWPLLLLLAILVEVSVIVAELRRR